MSDQAGQRPVVLDAQLLQDILTFAQSSPTSKGHSDVNSGISRNHANVESDSVDSIRQKISEDRSLSDNNCEGRQLTEDVHSTNATEEHS